MHRIEYRQHLPLRARTWYARFRPSDLAWLEDHLSLLLCDIAEASVCGTLQDQRLWSVATCADHQLWSRSLQHGSASNTLQSVLSGCVRKLRSGSDLSARQLGYIEQILAIMTLIRGDTGCEFVKVKEFTADSALERLQSRLFHCD